MNQPFYMVKGGYMSKKVDEKATCPYCGHNECGIKFDINVKMVLTVTNAKKYKYCLVCDKKIEY
jgi:hypothetical protein